LSVRHVTRAFGGLVAVSDFSLELRVGELIGLIGPNGAGKTTLLDVITGFTRQQTGVVVLDGVDVSRWTPERRARTGIARSWQSVELFEELTVRDNLRVAEDTRGRLRYLRDLVVPDRRSLSPFAESVVDDLGLRAVIDQRPATLPHGVIKLVGIARTIIASPAVILLDEPAAGLDDKERRELAALIRQMADRHGIGVVVIEHDMALILNTCDRIVVLDFGRMIADDTPSAVRTNDRVVKAYLGEPTDGAAATSPSDSSTVGTAP